MPPGRVPVKTALIAPDKREKAYKFVRDQIAAGRQAFAVYPVIEESETLQVRAAEREFERLRNDVFPDLEDGIGLLHGRMSNKKKTETMNRFREGGIKLLVSTAVVEVGVDVPNAAVMIIEGAERFGLAQLHQFRGTGRAQRSAELLHAAQRLDRRRRKRAVAGNDAVGRWIRAGGKRSRNSWSRGNPGVATKRPASAQGGKLVRR